MEENELTYKYKMVVETSLPARLIITRNIHKEPEQQYFHSFGNLIYEGAFDAMHRLIMQGNSKQQIVNFMKENLPDASNTDLTMIFYNEIKSVYENINTIH